MLLVAFSCFIAHNGHAQRGTFNYFKFSKKNYYFGITLGFNSSKYFVGQDKSFIKNDSIRVIESINGPGFNLGIVTNIKFGENFDLRFLLPTLSFADRRLEYKLTSGETELKKLESVFLEFPIHVRYKSKPYKDIRVFVVGGVKYSMDLASNSKARKSENLLKISAHDLVGELGLGFQIFFPYFILSPEMKFSFGMLNILNRDENLIYSSSINKLFSRGFAISLHFEG
ncbi:MAG: PorT family protein [Aureispira sp.]|nr:PorT family protein [Aureispira sp.]